MLRADLVIRPRRDLASVLGAVVIAYALLAYPAIEMLAGHPLSTLPVFGLSPCATVIFFFGLLLWARPPAPKYLLLLPLAWALNAAPANQAARLRAPRHGRHRPPPIGAGDVPLATGYTLRHSGARAVTDRQWVTAGAGSI